jgi:RNA recognition motif-containing protein
MNDISNRKVYVGNIPYTANKQEVEAFLKIVGPVINFEYYLLFLLKESLFFQLIVYMKKKTQLKTKNIKDLVFVNTQTNFWHFQR